MEKDILIVEKRNTIVIVRVQESRLYQHTINPLRDKIMSLVDSGESKLVVDLSGVDVMNSSALGVLILVWDRLNRSGGRMVISGLCPLMAELFNRMKLNVLFPVVNTEKEALRLLAGDKKIPAE